MSYKNYIKAMEMAPKCKFYTTAGGKSKEEINMSEVKLGISFSKQLKDFYEKYGYLSFLGNEMYGIDPEDESGVLEGNSVAYALNDRKEYSLPKEWVPIYNFDDGNMAYLDYSSLNEEKEPSVIMAFYDGKQYKIVEKLADDFGNFVLLLLQDRLIK